MQVLFARAFPYKSKCEIELCLNFFSLKLSIDQTNEVYKVMMSLMGSSKIVNFTTLGAEVLVRIAYCDAILVI